MTSRFQRQFKRTGAANLNRQFGVSGVLHRGSNATKPFQVRRYENDSPTEKNESNGPDTKFTTRVFLLPVESVVFDTSPVSPRTADRLNVGDEVFEILPPGPGVAAVKICNGDRDWMVHTKRVS